MGEKHQPEEPELRAKLDASSVDLREPNTHGAADVVSSGATPPPPRPDAFPHARLFRDREPRAILGRLTDGDPLGIESRCAMRMRERAYMIDNTRLTQRTQARAAIRGRCYQGDPPLGEWILHRVDESIDALLAEDREEEHSGLTPYEPWDPRFTFLSYAVGVLPEYCRTASVRFNSLPFAFRLSFFKLCIECISVDEALELGLGPPEVLRERTLKALICFWRDVAYEDFSFVAPLDEFLRGGDR